MKSVRLLEFAFELDEVYFWNSSGQIFFIEKELVDSFVKYLSFDLSQDAKKERQGNKNKRQTFECLLGSR